MVDRDERECVDAVKEAKARGTADSGFAVFAACMIACRYMTPVPVEMRRSFGVSSGDMWFDVAQGDTPRTFEAVVATSTGAGLPRSTADGRRRPRGR